MTSFSLVAITISPGTFLVIVSASMVAGIISAVARYRGLAIPVVVLELVLGVIVGPHVLGLKVTPFISFFSDLGLGMLFFFAGYEIDVERIRGLPLRLGLLGWAMSLAIAYALGGLLAASGVVLSLIFTGSALASTALGTLLPILTDAGQLRTRLGSYLLGAGAVGEFGPVLLVTLVLSAQSTLHNGLILAAFIAIVVLVAVSTLRFSDQTLPMFQRTIDASSQVAVRSAIVLIFALAFLAYKLGLDLLLGGFAAGMITRQLLKTHEIPELDSKLTAVAFGVFVPFFFIVSGMNLDVTALFASPSGVEKCLLFFVLFFIVRGTPALVLYRQVLGRRQQLALALFSATQLPLVVAITSLATASGHMRPSTAAALVGAAVLSTLVYPILGLRVATQRTPKVAAVPDVSAQVSGEADRHEVAIE